MSEQGEGGYGDGGYGDGGYGAGATGADAFAADEGIDQHYLGAPQGDGLDRIHARMDEMTAQQQAIVEALQSGYEDDDYDDEDGEQPTVEELAAQYGVSPEELLALSEQYEEGEQQQEPDIFELIDRSVDRHAQAIDAEHAVLDRDEDFADLRESIPILQDEQTARAIVNRAQDLAEAWDPQIIQTPAFVDLIELVAKAVVGDRAVGREQRAGIPRLQLESAQGAEQRTPPPPDSEYWGDKIVQAAQRLRPQI
jgi:hypothetical protein